MPRVKIIPVRASSHNEGRIVCPFPGCEYSVRNELGMRLHLRAGHGTGSDTVGVSVSGAVCSVCAMRFRNASAMTKHASETGHFLR